MGKTHGNLSIKATNSLKIECLLKASGIYVSDAFFIGIKAWNLVLYLKIYT
jgi:hypothetical protein